MIFNYFGVEKFVILIRGLGFVYFSGTRPSFLVFTRSLLTLTASLNSNIKFIPIYLEIFNFKVFIYYYYSFLFVFDNICFELTNPRSR